jgi:TolB-like protein
MIKKYKGTIMRMQKILILIILSLLFILKAEDLDRIAIFPFKTNGVDIDNSLVFVDSLRKEVCKSKQYEMMEYAAMNKILSYNGYKGDNLCYDDECAYVMGAFLSVNKVVQGLIKKRRNTFSVNIRFIDMDKEEIILDVTEHFKGTFEELLVNKIPKFAEMINWSTRYLNSMENNKKIKRDNKFKLRILFGITSIVTAGSGLVMNYLVEEKIKEYKRREEEFNRNISNISYDQKKTLNKRYEDSYKTADQRMMLRNVLYSLAGTGLCCFSITFFF